MGNQNTILKLLSVTNNRVGSRMAAASHVSHNAMVAPTWPAEVVREPTTFVVTELGFTDNDWLHGSIVFPQRKSHSALTNLFQPTMHNRLILH